MKANKFVSGIVLAGVILGLGALDASNNQVQAATVISESAFSKTMSFNREDLKTVSGIDFNTSKDVATVYSALKNPTSWETLGYTSEDATLVANRFAYSYYQALGILTDLANNPSLELKVVTTNTPGNRNVSIGTIGEAATEESTAKETETEKPITEESVTEESTTEEDTVQTSALSSTVRKLSVDIEYKKQNIELKFQVKSDGRIKAEFDNEFTGVELKDTEAQQVIETLFEGLDIQNSDQDSLKNQIITRLNASNDFKKFKFKAELQNGTKVEFKLK